MLATFNLTQLIGLVAMSIWVGAMAAKTNKRLNQYWTIGNIFWVLHYSLMNAWAGAASASVNIIRSLSFIYLPQPQYRKFLLGGLSFLYISVNAPFIHKAVDIFPVIACLLTCFAFYVVSILRSRWLLIASSAAWLVYGLINHSIGQILASIFSIIVGLVTIARLWREHKLNSTGNL